VIETIFVEDYGSVKTFEMFRNDGNAGQVENLHRGDESQSEKASERCAMERLLYISSL
jgi:hypothetical protein